MDNPAAPGSQSCPECTSHPGTEAVARCISCNRLLCAWCRVVRGNRNYCRSCAATSGLPTGDAGTPVAASGYPPPPGSGYPASAPGYGRPPPPPPGGYPQYGGYPPHGAPPGSYGYQQYPVPAPYQRPQRAVVFPGAPWGVGEVLVIFGISFLVGSGLSYAVYAALRQSFSSTTATFLLIFLSSVILYTLLLAGTFYSVKVRHGSTLTALGLKLDGLGGSVAFGAMIGLPLFIAAIGLAYVSQLIFRNSNTPDTVSKSVTQITSGSVSSGLILLLIVTLVVLAPICEEIFFRGYLYPALRNRMDMLPAVIINGVLFAAAHFELIGFLPRALLGAGLCYIYEREHNLAGAMIGHALYNGLILLISGVFRLF